MFNLTQFAASPATITDAATMPGLVILGAVLGAAVLASIFNA